MLSICKSVSAAAAAGLAAPVLAASVLAATIFTIRSSDAAEPAKQVAAILTEIPAEQQIQLAMSAAPPEIARNATILL